MAITLVLILALAVAIGFVDRRAEHARVEFDSRLAKVEREAEVFRNAVRKVRERSGGVEEEGRNP